MFRAHLKNLYKKKAVVTGAASGIGSAIALELARHQCELFLIDINAEGLNLIADEIRALGVHPICHVCDVGKPDQISTSVREIFATWGEVDILVNNAGICFYGLSIEMSVDQWNEILAVNLLAPIQYAHELLPCLLKRPQSHILNVASMYGLFVSARCTAYHTTKYGLVGFSEALRAEYNRFGLGVTAFCPGFARTNLFQSMRGRMNRKHREPPPWICASTTTIARRAVQAIRYNQRLVVVTPLARLGYWCKRFFPGLMAMLVCAGRRRTFFRPVRIRNAEPSPAVRSEQPTQENTAA